MWGAFLYQIPGHGKRPPLPISVGIFSSASASYVCRSLMAGVGERDVESRGDECSENATPVLAKR